MESKQYRGWPALRLIACVLVALACTGPLEAMEWQVATNGNVVSVTLGAGLKGGQCCVGAALDDQGAVGGLCSQGCPTNPVRTIDLFCNRTGAHTVWACWSDDYSNGRVCETKQVFVSDPPPPTCPAFTITSQTSRALTHKYGSEEYPQGQIQDAQVKILFKPITVATGTTIYVKVEDPKDSSTYRTNAAPNDNNDTAAGNIGLSPSDTGTKTFQFTAPAEGVVNMYLNTTGFAAGDNYNVKASASPNLLSDPQFFCGASFCQETQPITAWKRVYLEKKRMFRAGAFIVDAAPAGQNQATVQLPSGVTFRAGDEVRLIHAPRLDGGDLFRVFYFEDAVVTAVDRVAGSKTQKVLTFAAPLAHDYTNDDSTSARGLTDGISDGVGIKAAGFYERNEAYMDGAFQPAFVELMSLTTQVTEVPYMPTIPDIAKLANKWFEHSPAFGPDRRGDENVKHVLAGSGRAAGRGLDLREWGATATPTVQLPNANASWTFVEAIEQGVRQRSNPIRGLDPAKVNGENCVHEFAHTFGVNYVTFSPDRGHCSQMMALQPALACTMNKNTDRGDGTVGFHWASDQDSEYITIRRRTEPLPAP